jgi:hypothetical protein
MTQSVQKIHLVGSVPLADAREVFTTVAETLGDRVSRIPDGETGERRYFIDWHVGVIAAARRYFEWVSPSPDAYAQLPSFRLRKSTRIEDIQIGPFGYAEWARKSYEEFARLKTDGVIGPDVRFQVNIPTAVTPVNGFFADDETKIAVERLYEDALFAEVAEIGRDLPADELAIQWDVVTELGMWEEHYRPYFDGDVRPGIIERLQRCVAVVPEAAELGLHLCYGDYQHRHFMEPTSLRVCVEIANGVGSAVSRELTYVHMPVPRERDEQAYFQPLADLELGPNTELYLGLVHMTDGVPGTQRRIRAAETVTDDFGIATECGFGRRPAETIPELLAIHREVVDSRVPA